MNIVKVVARFADGRVVKGHTEDFFPNKETFHIQEEGGEGGGSLLVERDTLKALFFVKSYEGDRHHVENLSFDGAKGQGRKMLVTFADGETMAGFTMGFSKGRPGFFLFPTDGESNNERVFVVLKAVRAIKWVN